jgi:hypothetical protein
MSDKADLRLHVSGLTWRYRAIHRHGWLAGRHFRALRRRSDVDVCMHAGNISIDNTVHGNSFMFTPQIWGLELMVSTSFDFNWGDDKSLLNERPSLRDAVCI